MLLLLILTAFARICTGWHWPLDVIASGLIGYLLVKVCFAINLKRLIGK
jgi:membrane-associated phospholipid phosphatase